MKPVVIAIATALGLLAGTSSAQAEPALAMSTVELYNGPGAQFGTTGVFMSKGQMIDANCDGSGWCQVTVQSGYGAVTGWIDQGSVRLGGVPQPQPQPVPRPQPQPQPWPQPEPWPLPQPQPPRPQPVPPPVYEEAGACFYSERNFRGSSFCLDEGDEYSRLPRGWNDKIRSVEVFGGARVDLCTDTNFYGSCVTLRSNTSRLPAGVDRRVSSLEVY